MKEPEFLLEKGTRVRTFETIGPTHGMMVHSQHLSARRPNAEGTIRGVVAGHGGDVYWVHHGDESIPAAYCWAEFELVGKEPDEELRQRLASMIPEGAFYHAEDIRDANSDELDALAQCLGTTRASAVETASHPESACGSWRTGEPAPCKGMSFRRLPPGENKIPHGICTTCKTDRVVPSPMVLDAQDTRAKVRKLAGMLREIHVHGLDTLVTQRIDRVLDEVKALMRVSAPALLKTHAKVPDGLTFTDEASEIFFREDADLASFIAKTIDKIRPSADDDTSRIRWRIGKDVTFAFQFSGHGEGCPSCTPSSFILHVRHTGNLVFDLVDDLYEDDAWYEEYLRRPENITVRPDVIEEKEGA